MNQKKMIEEQLLSEIEIYLRYCDLDIEIRLNQLFSINYNTEEEETVPLEMINHECKRKYLLMLTNSYVCTYVRETKIPGLIYWNIFSLTTRLSTISWIFVFPAEKTKYI